MKFGNFEVDIRRMKQPPISTWQEMKATLRQKYLPNNYYDKLFEQVINLKQIDMLVIEYMQKFDELKTLSQKLKNQVQDYKINLV